MDASNNGTELPIPFSKEVAKAVDPDLGQYKANFEDIEKGADESARWYSRYEVEDEANEYIDEILGIQDENTILLQLKIMEQMTI